MKIIQESSNIQLSVEESQNKEDLNTRITTNEPIEGTPFRIVGNEIKGYFIACGKYRLTDPTETVIEAYELLENEKWNILVRVITAITETINDERNNTEDEKIHP